MNKAENNAYKRSGARTLMFSKMTNVDLLEFCAEHFSNSDICEALCCEDLCVEEDCPLAQLFDRFRSIIKKETYNET